MRGGKSGRLGYNFQQIGVITMTEGTITKVAGPLVIAEGMRNADMFDVLTKQTRSKLDLDWISRSFNSILSDSFYSISNAF